MSEKSMLVGKLMAGCDICGRADQIHVLEPNFTVNRHTSYVLCEGCVRGWELSAKRDFWSWIVTTKYRRRR
jgi:hypothetical protein